MAEADKRLPETGEDKAALLERMRALREGDINWRDNRAFSLVFHQDDPHTEFLKQAYTLFFEENGLNPMAFASLRKMEHDVVRMTADLLHGGPECVGTLTSGGTESVMLAVRTYRDKARREKPWIRRPEMIVPESIHVAFHKAAKYFDVRMVVTPLRADGAADPGAMAAAVTPQTIAIAGSAPNYPNGMVDPISELGALAQERDVWLHVDACVGGFFLPFAEALGHPIPVFDFRVPGVTSMSADLHKYGYAAKGASTVLYRNLDFLRHQFFVHVDWPGGVFASPSMPGTRPGGAIAAAWAALHAMGRSGYEENVRRVMAASARFMEGIRAIPELEIVGAPPVGVFCYASKDKRVNIFAVADQMQQRGWHVDRQQKPDSIHLMINPGHAGVAETYLTDLRDSVAAVKENPDLALSGSAPAYGLMTKAPARGLVAGNVLGMMLAMYSADGKAPELGPGSGEDADGGMPEAPPGVPRPLWFAMKLKARLSRLFR